MPWGSMGSIWAEFGLDYTKFQQGVQQVTRELVTLDGKYQEAAKRMEQTVNAAMERLGATISAASSKQSLLGDSFDGNAAKARALEQALDELLMAGVSPTNQRVQELAKELQSVQGRMEEAAQAAQQMSTGMESVGQRVQALAQQMTQVGSQMSIGLSLPLSALTGFAAKASADFESAMAKVWTITDMTKGQLDSLGSQLERLSSSIPQSAQQLAAGLYDAIGSGITDVAEAMEVLEVAAKAGQAGATSTAVAMDALTSAINAYGMEASQAGQLADVMFRAMDKGKLTFEEIAGNLGQVISTAAVAGVQFEEVAAAFATLTKGGVGAAEAATAVNQAILTIIQPSEQAAAYAEQLGIEFNAAALASKGLSGVLEDVYQATGGNIESMTTLFSNVRALKGALGLTRNEMQDYKSDLDSMATASGAAERAFEKQMQTSAAQAQLFRNEIANLGRAFGAELLPMLNSLIERIKPLVQAFTELPDGVKQAAIVFATVTAAIGPLMAAVGGLVTLMSGPAGWIVAIAAVGAAIYGLVSSVRDLEGQIDRQIDRARAAITEAMSQADAYGRQADALDKLISEYDELAGKPDQSEAEHERLRQVIDEIVRLAPTAVTGYDDMGRALIGNAEAARKYRDELWSLRNDQLELAAMRVRYELPRLEEQLKTYKPEFETVKKDLDKIKDQYWAMRRYFQEVSLTKDLRKQEELLEKAYAAGTFERHGAPPVTQYLALEKQYNTLYDRYGTLGAIIEKATLAVIELKQAEEELAEHQKLKPGLGVEEAKHLEKAKREIEDIQKKYAGNTARQLDELEKLQKAYAKFGDVGVKAVAEIGRAMEKLRAGSGGGPLPDKAGLTAFQEWTKEIETLPRESYGKLRAAWDEIAKDLDSDSKAKRFLAEEKAGALINAMTKALKQSGGDFKAAANAASLEVKSGFASLREKLKAETETDFQAYGRTLAQMPGEVFGGLIDEWARIADEMKSEDPAVAFYAQKRAQALVNAITAALTANKGDRDAAFKAALAEYESDYENMRQKIREGTSDDDIVRGLVQDAERKAALEDWGYERTADAIQKILDAETMSAKLRGDLAYKVATLRKDAAAEAAKAEKNAAEQASREAEKAAKEATAQQEQHVRERIQAVQREATLNDWSYSQIADALQEVLDTEEMAARTRVDLAYDVALNRKRAADKATADEKRAAEEAAKAAEQQAREAERQAQEAERAQDARVKARVQGIDRVAELEDWSLAAIADAIQGVLDAEQMTADLRSDLAHRVAMNRKRFAEDAATAEKKAAEDAARDAQRQAQEADRQRDQSVRDRVQDIQRQASLEEWSYGRVADAIQEVLDTSAMSAKLQSDLAYDVAANRKRAADQAKTDEKKAADEAAREAEKRAREAEQRAQEQARAQDERVRNATKEIQREAALEEWSYTRVADAIQAILDAEEMSASLRSDLAYDVAMNRKRALDQATQAEKKAAEEAARQAERQAEEAKRQQDQSVRDRVQQIQRQATLEEWGYGRIADAIQEALDAETMSATLRSDLAWDVAINRKRASDKATADEKRAAEEAAKTAEKRARDAERLAAEAIRTQDEAVKARQTAVQREAQLNDWSYAQIADALQGLLDSEQMSAKLRSDLAYEVAANRKRASDEATKAEKQAAEEAARQAEKQAKEAERRAEEAARARDEAVKERQAAISRTAYLEEWSYSRIADALQGLLDSEQMSAKLRSDLAYEVAANRKRASDEATKAEKAAADKALRDAEVAAREAERTQEQRVRERVTQIERQAYLEEWSLGRVADAIQAVLDAETMSASLRSDLANQVAVNRKRAADQAKTDEKKAAEEAAKAAEKQAKEAERLAVEAVRTQDEAVKARQTAVQREAQLNDWSYAQIADGLQETLDTEEMSAKLRSDLAYEVAANRKRASDEAAKAEKAAAEKAQRDAETAAREAERAQEQNVREQVTQIERRAYLEEWSYDRIADAIQGVLDTETMSARLRLDLANDVAVNRKRASDEAAKAEKKAAEEAAKAAEKQATEEAKAQDERVRGLIQTARRQAELNDWSYTQVAQAIREVLDAETMSTQLRADLEHEAAMNRKRAADKAARDAEQQAKDAEKALQDEIRAQDARVKARQQAVQRMAALEDWSSEQIADALQEVLDNEEMTAELRVAIAHEVAMARKRAAAEGAAAEAKAEADRFALRQRLGLVTAKELIRRESDLAEASQQNANARAGAVGRLYETVMGLANEAKLDELKGIRETMKALQLKYEAMGEGWELYALAAKMALEQVDGMIGDKEKGWGKTLADNILRNLGALGDVILSYQRNVQTYGDPGKALVMTLADLVMKSRQFAALVDALNPLIEELIDMFGQLIAPLVPIVDILVRILTPVIRAVAAVFAWVADVVVGIWNAIAKTINALLGWLGVHIPTIEADWRKDYGLDKDQGGKAGTQISEITGPTRDLLVELMRPLRVLDSLPVYAASVERAIYSMRDAFIAYAGGQAAASGAAAAVVNNYYSISTINIYSSGEEDFDQLMQSLNRRAELALLGSGA